MRGTVGLLSFAWLAAALAAGGCSMFDQVGGGELSFGLPPATFRIDTTDSRWWPSPPMGVPQVVCRGPAALVTDCCQPPPPMAAVDCQEYPLSCADDAMCALAFDYDDAEEIDLGIVPALQDQRRSVLAQATVEQIDTQVDVADAGALPLRATSLYVAPQGTSSTSATGAIFLAAIPLTSGTVNLAASAQLAFSSFLMDFNTPFTLILSTHAVVESGPAPTGAVTIVVNGRVKASF
jgi:hypothetical protein